MRIFKIALSFVLIFSMLSLAIACSGGNTNQAETSQNSAETSEKIEETSENTTETTEKLEEESKVPESIKILAIGNSFSVDAMEYLYQIAKDAGVKKIVLGNLRVSGCTLDMHYNYATNKTAKYRYLKNTTGTWKSTEGNTLLHGLQDEDWDIITLQQGSHESGLVEKYSNLKNLAEYVKDNATNSDVKLYWHMTWAYQEGCTYKYFANYNNDQMNMYNMIVNATKNKVLSLDLFEDVIPSGTAVQNVRTSFLGDNINRDDGYHMSQPMGRYLVGLTYFAALTGADISGITYTPSNTASSEMIAMFKECVTNAINNKFAVTPSKYTTNPSDSNILKSLNLDPSKYTALLSTSDWNKNAYYNTASSSNWNVLNTSENTSSANLQKFAATKMLTKEQLPVGSVIILDSGYTYRPEGWASLTDKSANTASRPAEVNTNAVIVTADWWGNYVYRGFNIKHGNNTYSSDADFQELISHLRIYVPNNT